MTEAALPCACLHAWGLWRCIRWQCRTQAGMRTAWHHNRHQPTCPQPSSVYTSHLKISTHPLISLLMYISRALIDPAVGQVGPVVIYIVQWHLHVRQYSWWRGFVRETMSVGGFWWYWNSSSSQNYRKIPNMTYNSRYNPGTQGSSTSRALTPSTIQTMCSQSLPVEYVDPEMFCVTSIFFTIQEAQIMKVVWGISTCGHIMGKPSLLWISHMQFHFYDKVLSAILNLICWFQNNLNSTM